MEKKLMFVGVCDRQTETEGDSDTQNKRNGDRKMGRIHKYIFEDLRNSIFGNKNKIIIETFVVGYYFPLK